MNRTTIFALGLAGTLSLTTGCTAPSDVDDEESDALTEELNATSLRGYFKYDQLANTSRWLQAIALHDDGTFEANVGNNQSDLSGHHHPAAGTYSLQSTANGALLTLTYEFFGARTDRYDVEVVGTHDVKMKLVGGDNASWFTMKKEKAVTLTFGANWTVSQDGPLVAGRPLVVRYAASRNGCTAPAAGSLSTELNATVDGQRVWWIVQPFGKKPVNGVLGSVGHVPQGHHLALWFKNGALTSDSAPTCTKWDSHFGANYTFDIAQH
jgi:hypothetical protein